MLSTWRATENEDLTFDLLKINSSLSSESRHAETKLPHVGSSSCRITLSMAIQNRKFEFQVNGKNMLLIN